MAGQNAPDKFAAAPLAGAGRSDPRGAGGVPGAELEARVARRQGLSAKGVDGETFRVGRVLGRSFSLLFRNIGPVGLLALALLSLPYVVCYFLEYRYYGGPFSFLEGDSWPWPSTVGLTLQFLAVACLEAVLVVGVHETLQGRHPGARALVRRGLARLPPFLLVVVAVVVPDALPFVVRTVSYEMAWVGEALFPAVLLSVLAWVFLMVAIPAAVVEGLGVNRAINRSFELVRSHTFRVVGLVLALALVMVAAFAIVVVVVLLTLNGIDSAAVSYHVLVWPDLLLTAFLAALSGVVATVAFHDLRTAREGPDVARVAAVFD